MNHVFISYSSSDRERARTLADLLTAKGWPVWWDRAIPPGREFDEVIEEAINTAKCVVVLWSSSSVTSRWVKTEAAEAIRKNMFVPAMIENTALPLEFKRIQAADLTSWQGERDHPELIKLFRSIQNYLDESSSANPSPEEFAAAARTAPSRETFSSNSTKRTWIKGRLPFAAVGVIVLIVISYFAYVGFHARLGSNGTDSPSTDVLSSKSANVTQAQAAIPAQLDTLSWRTLTPDYVESFVGGKSSGNWWNLDKSDLPWVGQRSDGTYCMSNDRSAGGIKYVHLKLEGKSHFESPVSVKVRADSKEPTAYSGGGLLYRFDRADRFYYAFTLAPSGEINFHKRNSSGLSKLFSGEAKAIRKSDWNILGIVGRGPRLYLYTNETLAKVVEDSELQGSETGVVGMSLGRYCLDDFTVYRNLSLGAR